MSCRALGRGAEDVLMGLIVKRAEKRNCQKIVATYLKSKKNGQVADLFSKQNFKLIDESEEGSIWELSNENFSIKEYPIWIDVKEKNIQEDLI
jgi:predicted enzyme involved in methoxymalonyl-ACP biosynthesis